MCFQPRIDQYFSQLNKIVNEKRTSARVRFMIQDVLELRKVIVYVLHVYKLHTLLLACNYKI